MSSVASAVHVPRERGPRFVTIAADGIRFLEPLAAASDPILWLEAFRAAAVNNRPVSEQVRTCIRENLDRFDLGEIAGGEDGQRILLDLLFPRPGLYLRLSEMWECGLFDRLFPDVRALVSVKRLESLTTSVEGARARFSALVEEVRQPELLTLALLLHDCTSNRDHDHDVIDRARPLLDRLQLAEGPAAVVELLLAHHRQMARVAFRRDAENPDVISSFAAIVASDDLLKMLCLMTLVHLESLQRGALTPWRVDRLWRLYRDASNRLALGAAGELGRRDDAGLAVVMAGRPDDISESELTGFIASVPRAYLSVFGVATIYSHVRLARGILPSHVHASFEQHGDVWELTVVTLDKPMLFCNISGVLSHFGMDIHRGQAMTTADGLVLAVFEFTDAAGYILENRWAIGQMHRTLETVVAGTIDVSDLASDGPALPIARPSSAGGALAVDVTDSEDCTVVEIIADDGPGLLHAITRVVATAGCGISLALVSTEQGRAVDVLHVTKDGGKLTDGDRLALQADLARVLACPYPPPIEIGDATAAAI
jgi:[protein-PII] uridylyltransferase